MQEKCTTSTDILNEVDDNAESQRTGVHHDSDHREDLGDSSEQVRVSSTPTEDNADREDRTCESNDSIVGTSTGSFDQEGRLAVSTGNIDTQQTSEDPLNSEPSTVEFLKKNTKIITGLRTEIRTKVKSSKHSDAVLSKNSLKDNHPIVAQVSAIEGELASDNGRKGVQALEADTQATREGYCKDSAASREGLNTSPVVVEFATSKSDLVLSKAIPSMETFSHSKSLKETPNHPKPGKETLFHSKSLREVPTHLESHDSKSLKGISEEAQRPVSISENQEETNRSSGASSTVLTSEIQSEIGMSQEDSSTVSASTAQEESSESSEALSTVSTFAAQEESSESSEALSTVSTFAAQEKSSEKSEALHTVSVSATQKESSSASGTPLIVLNSEAQEVGMGLEDPSAVSKFESPKEVSMSSKAASRVSASEALEESSVIAEAPISVLISEAQKVSKSQEASSMVLDSVVKEGVDKISEASSTLSTSDAQEEVSVSSEASRMVPSSEVPKDVAISLDSRCMEPTLEAQEEISKSLESSKMLRNSEVQNEVGIRPEALSRFSEAEEEINSSSEAPSTVSTFEAQKDIGIGLEEITNIAEVPEGLQRKSSQIGKEKENDFAQNPLQQSESTVGTYEGGLQAGSEEGNKISVPTGDVIGSNYSQTLTEGFQYELAQKDLTIADLDKKIKERDARSSMWRGRYEATNRNFDDLYLKHQELNSDHQDLRRRYREKEAECAGLSRSLEISAKSYEWHMSNMARSNIEKDKLVRELRGQLEQMKKENGILQNQMSLLEQLHANEQSRGGSYLDDTKAATPALLVSALNGVKDASNNFVKVLRASLQQGSTLDFEKYIGAVSRNGHIKFQYQAYICRILFKNFDLPYGGSSKVALPPTKYFHQYQTHDLKKTDTVERLLHHDPEIDASLHQFCFDKFSNLMEDIEKYLLDRSIDLKQQVRNKQHPQDSKLYVSFSKLAVSVWLLQRLAFSFLHPAKQFFAQRGEPFNMSRMQSVVPLDEPGADEEVQLKVGFYVLPGFDIGNSAIPCEVYVTMK